MTIRINLLGEQKDNTPFYLLQLIVFCAAIVLMLGSVFIFHDTYTTKLDLLTNEKALLVARDNKLQEKTRHVEQLDKSRKLLAEKLQTIARLKSKKQGPVHILDDLTQAIPERAWLSSVNQKGDVLDMSGVALDPQTVSLFMGNLKNSKYFKNVDLQYSRQYVREGVKLQQFSLVAQLTNLLELQQAKQSSQQNRSGQKPRI